MPYNYLFKIEIGYTGLFYLKGNFGYGLEEVVSPRKALD